MNTNIVSSYLKEIVHPYLREPTKPVRIYNSDNMLVAEGRGIRFDICKKEKEFGWVVVGEIFNVEEYEPLYSGFKYLYMIEMLRFDRPTYVIHNARINYVESKGVGFTAFTEYAPGK